MGYAEASVHWILNILSQKMRKIWATRPELISLKNKKRCVAVTEKTCVAITKKADLYKNKSESRPTVNKSVRIKMKSIGYYKESRPLYKNSHNA